MPKGIHTSSCHITTALLSQYFRIKASAICGSSVWELSSHTLILVVRKGLLPLFVARSILLCVSFGPFIFWFYKLKWYNSETRAQGEKITYLQIRHIGCHKTVNKLEKQVTLTGSKKLKRQPGCLNHSVSKFQHTSETKLQPLTFSVSLVTDEVRSTKDAILQPLPTLTLFAANLELNFCLPASC